MLLYSIWVWDQKVQSTGETLLGIQKDLNLDLRQSVTNLQNRLVRLPALLETDPGKRIYQWLKNNKTILNETTLVGRPTYKSIYNRTQRRDLAAGKFVVQKAGKNRVIVSKGIMDISGEFTDKVHQVILESQPPAADEISVRTNIKRIIASGRSGDAMRETLAVVKSDIADELIAAEKSRTRMLGKLESIENTRNILKHTQQQKKQTILIIGALTILANIFIIFFLTRTIILKPLQKVIISLKGIAKGEGDLTRTLPNKKIHCRRN